jgi:hypothetical protein
MSTLEIHLQLSGPFGRYDFSAHGRDGGVDTTTRGQCDELAVAGPAAYMSDTPACVSRWPSRQPPPSHYQRDDRDQRRAEEQEA